MLQVCIIILIQLLLSGQTYCQSISGIVYDKEKNEAIKDAYVFINESSIGTITDESGKFTLELNDLINLTLILSHISYENKSINIKESDNNIDTIFLIKNSFILNEVVLKAEPNKKLRKKRLKRFENAFLGSDKNRPKIEILNPESIFFYEKNGTLYAVAEDPIEIENKYLGYTINFFLEDFALQKNKDVIYKEILVLSQLKKVRKN